MLTGNRTTLVKFLRRPFHRALMRVRPASFAALIKRVARVQREEVVTLNGAFWIDPVSILGQDLAVRGVYEPTMVRTHKHYCRKGGVVLDVGANEGYFTVISAKCVGVTGKVIAIEPQARLRSVIERNLALNSLTNVIIETCALSNQNAEAHFVYGSSTNTGASRLAAGVFRGQVETVKTETLTSILDRLGIETVDFMKMDIEGGEYEAILGSPEVFEKRRIRALALEFHPRAFEQRRISGAPILDLLAKSGYVHLRKGHEGGDLFVLQESHLG